MKAKERLELLEKSCAERGVNLVYDDLRGEGGWCRLRDKHFIIVNRRASVETRVRVIHEALQRVPARAGREVPSTGDVAPGAAVPATADPHPKADGRH